MSGRLAVLASAISVLLLAGLVSAGGADAAAVPKLTGVSHVPLVAVAGARIALTAKVAGTGKRVAIGLVLGTPKGSAKGGLALGKGVSFARRGRRSVVVKGRVPKTVALNELRTLLICIDPAGAVAGKRGSACRKAARIATSGPSTQERLAAAKLAGRITQSKVVLYGLLALRGSKKVPAELKGSAQGPGGEEAAIKLAANSYGSLPLAIKKQVFPFFVPPQAAGSAWFTPGRNSRKRRGGAKHRTRVAASAAAGAPNCQGYDSVEKGIGSNQQRFPWQGIPTSDNKAIVWYGSTDDPKFKRLEGEERASAQVYARELPKIWKKLTAEFGQPQSDAKEPCFHGPDGRLDVYVGGSIVDIASNFDATALAITAPYPAVGNYPVPGKWCTDRPAWIAMKPGLPPWALAHEFMHVLQFSHRYASCDDPIVWWDEGGATWAGDFVYPDEHYAQKHWPELVTTPLSLVLQNISYGAWPFWTMIQRTLGTGALRSIFANLRSKLVYQAVDASVAGGFARQLPKFFLHVWNQSPVGESGFSITEAFKKWDKWDAIPDAPKSESLKLGVLPADTMLLKIQRKDFPPLSLGAYHRVTIDDDRIKQLKFTNDLVGKPGAHVDAMLHLADGTWKLADWTASKTVTLCRTNAGENVKDLIVVSTNAGEKPLAPFVHQLEARSTCALPKRFDGTWTRVYTWPGRGTWQETLQGTATFLRNPIFPPEADALSSVPYELDHGSVTWKVAGSDGACVFNGSATAPLTNDTSFGTPTNLSLENVSGRPGAPNPEPKPYYYSIRASIDPLSAPEYDVLVCNGGTAKESLVLPYLDVGYPSPFTADVPPEKFVKSADATSLQGHRVSTDPTNVFTIDDTWSFTGSG
jgi:hypothetical protein